MTVTWTRIVRDALVLLGILGAVTYWVLMTRDGGLPVDVRYYWAADPANLYPFPELAEKNGYNYSPAFEFVVGWWRFVPFEVFAAIWRAILLAALVYLAGPFTLFVLLTPPVASEINAGNIQILLALAIVLGFRWPAAWAFVLLTKVTPGIGLLWFVVRREWRSLGIALGATGAVAAGSAMLMPGAWLEWLDLLVRLAGREGTWAAVPVPFLVRLPIAVAVVVWGARTDRRWTVPVAGMLALPALWYGSLSMLLAVIALREPGRAATGMTATDRAPKSAMSGG